jgi:hypothetical protein
MAERPKNVSPEEWRAQRAAHWKRVNRMWSALIIIASALILARYFGWLSLGG